MDSGVLLAAVLLVVAVGSQTSGQDSASKPQAAQVDVKVLVGSKDAAAVRREVDKLLEREAGQDALRYLETAMGEAPGVRPPSPFKGLGAALTALLLEGSEEERQSYVDAFNDLEARRARGRELAKRALEVVEMNKTINGGMGGLSAEEKARVEFRYSSDLKRLNADLAAYRLGGPANPRDSIPERLAESIQTRALAQLLGGRQKSKLTVSLWGKDGKPRANLFVWVCRTELVSRNAFERFREKSPVTTKPDVLKGYVVVRVTKSDTDPGAPLLEQETRLREDDETLELTVTKD